MSTPSQSFSPPTIIPPSTSHDLTVIILHGRGDTSPNFAYSFFRTLSSGARQSEVPIVYFRQKFPNIKWIFPSAKESFSGSFQQHISEWFDIASLADTELDNERQRKGLIESVQQVRAIVEEEVENLRQRHPDGDGKKRVILGGISMGCATSVHVLLSLVADGRDVLAGWFGWCGWLPFVTRLVETVKIDAEDTEAVLQRLQGFYKQELFLSSTAAAPGSLEVGARALKGTPVIVSHCNDDYTVNVKLGHQLRDFVAGLDMIVSWTEYPSGGHWIKSPQAMDQFDTFLEEQMTGLKM